MRGQTQQKGWMMIAPQNPLLQFQSKFKELETPFLQIQSKFNELSKFNPIYIVDAVSSTAHGAVAGAIVGGLLDTISQAVGGVSPASYKAFRGPRALEYAVCFGVDDGISTFLERLNGKKDVHSCMIAGFGAGVMSSFVSYMGDPNQLSHAVGSGLAYALVCGGMYKLVEPLCKPQEEDPSYMKAKGLLKKFGLDTYEKNFKKGMLNDYTLPLLTDMALRDVKIPPGPRLLILDHIQRDPEISKSQKKSVPKWFFGLC